MRRAGARRRRRGGRTLPDGAIDHPVNAGMPEHAREFVGIHGRHIEVPVLDEGFELFDKGRVRHTLLGEQVVVDVVDQVDAALGLDESDVVVGNDRRRLVRGFGREDRDTVPVDIGFRLQGVEVRRQRIDDGKLPRRLAFLVIQDRGGRGRQNRGKHQHGRDGKNILHCGLYPSLKISAFAEPPANLEKMDVTRVLINVKGSRLAAL